MSNFVDIHSHTLPGVDDGSQSLGETRQILLAMKKLGFSTVFCTPHQYETSINPPVEMLQNVFEVLCEEVGSEMQLYLGAENFLDYQLMTRIENKTVPTLGKSKFVLYEMPHSRPTPLFNEAGFRMNLAGYKPILAHIERYQWMKTSELEKLHQNVRFQVNISSFLKKQSPKEHFKKAVKYMDLGIIDYLASDIHSSVLVPRIGEAIDFIIKTWGDKVLTTLLSTNPSEIATDVA
jgi:protein-tyrosine phosphatase